MSDAADRDQVHEDDDPEETVVLPAVIEDPPVSRAGGAPWWLAFALGTVAVVALGVAFASLSAARQAGEDLAAFQAEIFASGEVAAGTLNAASGGLAVLVDQPLVFEVSVNQDVPIVASVPFSRRLELPINVSIPISEVIETTITVDGPFGFDVPVDVTVPIELDLPIDLNVPIEIDEVIEVDTTTRLDLTVPVAVDLEETGLAGLVRQMSGSLERLADTIPTAR